MPHSFFRARPLLVALSATTWTVGLAGCPGQLDPSLWLTDAGSTNPSLIHPPADAAPAPTVVDAAPAQVTPKMDAPRATPTPDGGARPDAPAATSDGPVAAEAWCKDSAEVTTRLLTPKCGACHGSATKAGGLDLISPNAASRLIDVPAAAAACRDQVLVTVSPQVGGHFFNKLDHAVANCGDRMPLGVTYLSATEIQCLKDWLLAASMTR